MKYKESKFILLGLIIGVLVIIVNLLL